MIVACTFTVLDTGVGDTAFVDSAGVDIAVGIEGQRKFINSLTA